MRPIQPKPLNNHTGSPQYLYWNSVLKHFCNLKNTLLTIYDLDDDKFIFIHDLISDFLGYKPNDFLNERINEWHSLVDISDRKKFICFFFENSYSVNPVSKNSKNTLVYKIRSKNGNLIHVLHEQNILQLEHKLIFNSIIDITEKSKLDDFFNELGRKSTNGFYKKPTLKSRKIIEEVSEREHEVLRLIADGLSSREIANQLFISNHTAITHRKNLIEKFKVKNTAELIKEASKVVWFG